jgi:hypothetical protein
LVVVAVDVVVVVVVVADGAAVIEVVAVGLVPAERPGIARGAQRENRHCGQQ